MTRYLIILLCLVVGCAAGPQPSKTVSTMTPHVGASVIMPEVVMPPVTNELSGNFAVVGYTQTNGAVQLVAKPVPVCAWVWNQFNGEWGNVSNGPAIEGLWRDPHGVIVAGAINQLTGSNVMLQKSCDLHTWKTISCVTPATWNFQFPEDTNIAVANFYRLEVSK